MKSLSDYERDELEAELERRKEMEGEKPVQVVSPDFSSLIKMCQEYVDEASKNHYVDEDFRHYIFEEAIKCVFGSDAFDYINQLLK